MKLLLGLGSLLLAVAATPDPKDPVLVHGMTISCQTWGAEWGTDRFAAELDELAELGVNWIAIHPYAFVRRDGSLAWRELDPDDPPEWLARPIREARARGMALFVKPHLGYWGSPFPWRGAIDYPDPEERARFFSDYERWIVEVAACTRGADAFAVGTELALLNTPGDDRAWRRVIDRVRGVTDAKLTYAANWDSYERVTFWDALDAVGVQAYFPITESDRPGEDELRAGWVRVLGELRELHQRTGKPIVLTELGYNRSLDAARRPWSYTSARGAEAERAAGLQRELLRVGLDAIAGEEDWLRGAFLWKWFPGEAPRANFLLDRPDLRGVIAAAWRRDA